MITFDKAGATSILQQFLSTEDEKWGKQALNEEIDRFSQGCLLILPSIAISSLACWSLSDMLLRQHLRTEQILVTSARVLLAPCIKQKPQW